MPIKFVKTVNVEYCSVEVAFIDKLYAQIEELREALEAVEWHPHTLYCPWCGMGKEDGHAEDCQRQQALGGE